MKLSRRSFPHPVVGNADDVPDAAFQATTEMSTDKQNIYIDVKVACSSATINEMLATKKATCVLHVECSNTLYRRAHEFAGNAYQVSIPRDDLNDDVEVNAFVRAVQDLPDYRVQKAHKDYGDAAFDVKAGDILAIGEGSVFPIESSFDTMSRIGSIMLIMPATEDGDQPMRVDTNGDKIIVYLSKPDFEIYKLLKTHEALSGPLTTSIVLPVLLEALHILQDDEAAAGEEDGRRWVRSLTRRVKSLDLEKEKDLLVRAQRILELPIKRSLIGAKQAEEAGK